MEEGGVQRSGGAEAGQTKRLGEGVAAGSGDWGSRLPATHGPFSFWIGLTLTYFRFQDFEHHESTVEGSKISDTCTATCWRYAWAMWILPCKSLRLGLACALHHSS